LENFLAGKALLQTQLRVQSIPFTRAQHSRYSGQLSDLRAAQGAMLQDRINAGKSSSLLTTDLHKTKSLQA